MTLINLLFLNTGILKQTKVDLILQDMFQWGMKAGKNILMALMIFIVGMILIKILKRLVKKCLNRDSIDKGVQSFVGSLANIILIILLIVAVVSALGVNTTSFAALLASAGVAIGMALSGNLQNFAGGIVILLLKPYKVGDWVEANNYEGTVKEIQIFHTVIQTVDLKTIYAPNSLMCSKFVVNYSQESLRRAIWTISISYGNDVEYARELLMKILQKENLIVKEPTDSITGKPLAPYFIEVAALKPGSVDLTVRVYVKNKDFYPFYFRMQEKFYAELSKDAHLEIPFTSSSMHIIKDN